jgi:hypothetical protein
MIRCRDIHGPCCHQCHDDADDGVEGLDGLIGDQGVIVARVCCHKLGEAKWLLLRPPVQRGASFLLPKGNDSQGCFR